VIVERTLSSAVSANSFRNTSVILRARGIRSCRTGAIADRGSSSSRRMCTAEPEHNKLGPAIESNESAASRASPVRVPVGPLVTVEHPPPRGGKSAASRAASTPSRVGFTVSSLVVHLPEGLLFGAAATSLRRLRRGDDCSPLAVLCARRSQWPNTNRSSATSAGDDRPTAYTRRVAYDFNRPHLDTLSAACLELKIKLEFGRAASHDDQ